MNTIIEADFREKTVFRPELHTFAQRADNGIWKLEKVWKLVKKLKPVTKSRFKQKNESGNPKNHIRGSQIRLYSQANY